MIDLNNCSDVVLDTGLLLEYCNGRKSKTNQWLDQHIFSEKSSLRINAHEITRMELFYITCREKSAKEATFLVEELAQFITFHHDRELFDIAGRIKCYFSKHSISLADCLVVATGINLKCPTYFRRERELPDEVVSAINDRFESQIEILSN
ncbi:MAG: PIN domain-containing protein [Promethearchaeota archaeon]